MKVKIGDKIYSASKEPIMLILDDIDKQNIANILPKCSKYCAAPDYYNADQIKIFMDTYRKVKHADEPSKEIKKGMDVSELNNRQYHVSYKLTEDMSDEDKLLEKVCKRK